MWHARLAAVRDGLGFLARWAEADFGFEWINRQVVRLTAGTAEALTATQTGVLNWNVAGIVGGLVAVLMICCWHGGL